MTWNLEQLREDVRFLFGKGSRGNLCAMNDSHKNINF
jgi:hypothetical protein